MHSKLRGACDERLVFFKVVVKEGDGGCLKIGLAILVSSCNNRNFILFYFFLFKGLLGILFFNNFGCSLFLGVGRGLLKLFLPRSFGFKL